MWQYPASDIMKTPLLCVLLATAAHAAGESPIESLATKGKLLFADDFESRQTLGEWKQVIPTFQVADGVLVGSHTREDHGAVGRRYIDCKDVVVELRFKLAGAGINVVFDDKNHKGSHAGHLARVVLAPTAVRLGDDKEGAMRQDIYEARKAADPARKKEIDKTIADRSASFPHKLEQNQWHQLRLELVGDRMLVAINGKTIGVLRSPGLAHPTKTSIHFTVTGLGKQAMIDDVKMWQAIPAGAQ
jgi:hypothetical protein